MLYKLPFFLCLFFFLPNCAHNTKEEKLSPKEYFEKALYYKNKGDNLKALEYLKTLRKRFFFSSYNQKALLLTGDIHFAQKKYKLASQTYEKHLSLYPTEKKDYILYQIGLSYKKQLPSRADQDLSLSEPALKALNALLNLKESLYKKQALIEKQEILDKKARKELKAALFYKSQKWHQASFKRIEHFIKHYPESPLKPKALLTAFQLTKILDKPSAPFKEELIKKYPDSEEAKWLYKKKKDSLFSKWKDNLL